MQKICAFSGKAFEVSEEDLKFYEAISPVIAGKKYLIPSPTLCPEERRRRRLAFRKEHGLYHRNCDKCSKKLISVYSSDKPFTVYCRDCWWSDDWKVPKSAIRSEMRLSSAKPNGTKDSEPETPQLPREFLGEESASALQDPMSFGRDFDFHRPFFDQFADLQQAVPRLSIINFHDENSDYTNYGFQNKDCYLLFMSDRNEKCYYGAYVWSSFQCVDNLFLIESQHCYQCVDGDKLYECESCEACINCQNCFGCLECKNLKNCFGCIGIQNKEYCFQNSQLSKEEYQKRLAEALENREKSLSDIRQFAQQFPRRAVFQVNCENAFGDHLKNCKNVFMGFDGYDAEDSKYIANFPGGIHHCYDFDGAGDLEWSAEVISTGLSTNMVFAVDHNWNGANDVYYSSYCSVNKHLFGCIGLRHKEYCILNKQYSKTEYERLVPKIIEHMRKEGEWGEFFPIRISPFAYNETIANTEYPLSKEEAVKNGWKWKDEEQEILKVEKIIPAEKLPSELSKIPNDILSWAIECEVSKKPFKIIPQELEFYRRYGIPIPKKHPDIRLQERMSLRNPKKLWKDSCSSCGKETITSYDPERGIKILCEECFLKNR